MTANTLKRGDSWRVTWQLLDVNNQPIDLTGSSVRLNLRDRNMGLVVSANQSNGKISINAGTGTISLAVPYSEMDIPLGAYIWDLEVTFSNGVRQTVDEGRLFVVQDYTYE